MDFLGIIAWWLFGWAVAMSVFYAIIRAAIDGSETAQNIKEIRRILSKANNETIYTPEKEYDLCTIPYNECPACHENISESDQICPHCSIILN